MYLPLSLSLSMYLSLSLYFFGQVMSPHHPDQMPQGSQVSRVTLLLCSLKGPLLTHSLSQSVSDLLILTYKE